MIRKRVLALAAFAVAALAARPAPAAAAPTDYRFTCESRGYDRTYCSVNSNGSVRLYRQLSDTPCRRNETWGTDRRGVWVSRGCRAEFIVDTDGGYDRDDRYDRDGRHDRDDRYDRNDRYGRNDSRAEIVRAERACENAILSRSNARRRDVTVRYSGVTRTGLRVVRWSGPRRSGTCQVARNGRVVDIDYGRDRDNRRW